MRKIYRIKVCIVTVFILTLLLCTFDYIIVFHWGQPDQQLWPIYNWALGFEKISRKSFKGHAEVTLCDSPLNSPVPIKEFVRENGGRWQDTSDYNHLLSLAAQYYYNNEDSFTQSKKAFEADMLSQLPCHQLSYSLFVIEKNLITKNENKIFLKSFDYKKL